MVSGQLADGGLAVAAQRTPTPSISGIHTLQGRMRQGLRGWWSVRGLRLTESVLHESTSRARSTRSRWRARQAEILTEERASARMRALSRTFKAER